MVVVVGIIRDRLRRQSDVGAGQQKKQLEEMRIRKWRANTQQTNNQKENIFSYQMWASMCDRRIASGSPTLG